MRLLILFFSLLRTKVSLFVRGECYDLNIFYIYTSNIFVHVHHACLYFYARVSFSTVFVWVATIDSYSTANVIDFTHSQTVGLGVSHAEFPVHQYLLFRPTALEH